MSELQPRSSLRVAIVDDKPDVRALLGELMTLETSAVVVAEAEGGEHAARAVAESQAELVIMDYQRLVLTASRRRGESRPRLLQRTSWRSRRRRRAQSPQRSKRRELLPTSTRPRLPSSYYVRSFSDHRE